MPALETEQTDGPARSGLVAGVLDPLLVAFSFLTRLPLGGPMLEPSRLGRAVACFPLVGLALGGALVGLDWLLGSHFGAPLRAFLLLALWLAVTGALHADGVADVADALAGYRGDRQRALEIMKDSRIGAVGAAVLGSCLLGKWLALSAVLETGATTPLLVAPLGARWLSVVVLAALPSARASGLGFTMASATRAPHVVTATLFAFPVATLCGYEAAKWLIFSTLAGGALCVYLWRRIGGTTGDVLGAAIELSELFCLLAAAWR